MRILVLGGDGYLGWPTAMRLAARGDTVHVVDSYLRRRLALDTDSEPLLRTPNLTERCALFADRSGLTIGCTIADLCDYRSVAALFEEFQPEAIVHYAEQPSAPYSMMGYDQARLTLQNNLSATFNIIWGIIQHAPQCHMIKLGTMGEYGTPAIDIEEGYIEIEHKGRKGKFLFPRAAGSLYHTTKVLDTDLLYFYVRIYGICATDLMQGPVYGISTSETELDPLLVPNFHYDDIFGTVINRFLVQAAAGIPLTVYGKGGQTRGYLNLNDTLQCVELAARNPATPGELRIFNQVTEIFTINELARRIKTVGDRMGLAVTIAHIDNPRKEAEDHYYNPTHTGLRELGLQPHYLTDDILADMLDRVLRHRDDIRPGRMLPRVRWSDLRAASVSASP